LQGAGIDLVSGGTDNHLVLLKTDSVNMSGKEASELLEQVLITCNKNMVPQDKRSPFVTSGVRLGTPAVTTRGFKEKEIKTMGELIVKALKNPAQESTLTQVKKDVIELCRSFPVYP
jgi:glycine hydroxymethyltransferase